MVLIKSESVSYMDIMKIQEDDCRQGPFTLAIMGDCATQFIAGAVRGFAKLQGLDVEVVDLGFNQFAAQVLNDNSELQQCKPNAVLLVMSTDVLYEDFCNTGMAERKDFAERRYEGISFIWKKALKLTSANIIQTLFIENMDNAYGAGGLCIENSFSFQVKKLNYLLVSRAAVGEKIYFLDMNVIKAKLGERSFVDRRTYYLAKMPFSLGTLPCFAKYVCDVVSTLKGVVRKCIILDLDNTLWGGIIGEDGLNGIEIGELGSGKAFSDFQKWLLEMKRRGIILAVCSKNDEKTAKKPFLSHPDMVLRLEDFAMFVANWNDKVTNIKYIQSRLNIGMDSLVFIDDSSFERNHVAESLPSVTVPEMPENAEEYVSFLTGLNLFESMAFSANDEERTEQYRTQIIREEEQEKYSDYGSYLGSLLMRCVAGEFTPYYIPRIVQLTQRSNQFNLRTMRYSNNQIEKMTKGEDYITRYFILKDKYGEYGLVSAVIMEKREDGSLFIAEWVLSCRVLKRSMEEFIVNELVKVARQNGYSRIVGEYIPTPKNKMVENIYERLGFKRISKNSFEILVDEFIANKTYIEGEPQNG